MITPIDILIYASQIVIFPWEKIPEYNHIVTESENTGFIETLINKIWFVKIKCFMADTYFLHVLSYFACRNAKTIMNNFWSSACCHSKNLLFTKWFL